MSEKRKRKSGRRRKVIQGQRLTLAAVGAALVFYAALVVLTLTDPTFGLHKYWSNSILTVSVVVTMALAGAGLAIASYRGHPVMRPLYLILNLAGAVIWICWLGIQFVQYRAIEHFVVDLIGVGSALFVCWVFFCSKRARTFFEEQEFTVKRT